MSKLFSILAGLLLGTGCGYGNDSPQSDDISNSPQHNNDTEAISSEKTYAFDRVVSLLSSIWSDYLNLYNTCTPDGQNIAYPEEELPSDCEFVNLKFISPPVRPNIDRQRVLLIDRGSTYTGMIRFNNRILGIYTEDETTGFIYHHQPTIKVPKLFSEIMSSIQSFDVPLHSMIMESVGSKLLVDKFIRKLKFRNSLARGEIDDFHGSTILSKLMDVIPSAEVVLIDRPRSNGVPIKIFCTINTEHGLTWAQEYLDREFNGIQTIVDKYHIDFINMSYGSNYSELENAWSSNCSQNGPLSQNNLNKFVHFLSDQNKKISNLDGVVVFKSSSTASQPGSPDCIEEDNFIRTRMM